MNTVPYTGTRKLTQITRTIITRVNVYFTYLNFKAMFLYHFIITVCINDDVIEICNFKNTVFLLLF